MTSITKNCTKLKMSWIRDNYQLEISEASRKNRTHQEFLERILTGELEFKQSKATQRRLRAARLPGDHTLEAFEWSWPTKINADHIRHLANLNFMKTHVRRQLYLPSDDN